MGRPCAEFNPEAFLHVQGCAPLVREEPSAACKLPPRILSDRCVNVYFQELAPLFPVLHKPTFLHMYEEFLAGPEKVKCHHKIAQLFLVFSIAGISSESPDLQQLAACEQQWDQAIQAMLLENTMNSLQCLVLALLYCTIRADHKRVQHYKGLAVGLSHRLGLHQSQRRFTFGALTLETRKKVFWTLYTLDWSVPPPPPSQPAQLSSGRAPCLRLTCLQFHRCRSGTPQAPQRGGCSNRISL